MDTPDAFEWDEAKAEKNLVKHGLPFEFAIRVFTDPGQLDKIDGPPGLRRGTAQYCRRRE
jgi:uncharacterized DUF497 family protein